MKLRQILFTLFFTVLSASVFAQSAPAANQLAKLLNNYKTYQANFRQVTYAGRQQQKSSGKFYLQRPGKFRWEISRPNQQIIIANGQTLWMYEVELQQATKEKIDMKSGRNPAVLLSGNVNKLVKQYEVTRVMIRGKIWYQLKPRSSQSSFILVRMRFSNNRLIAIWVKNNLGQTTLFQFSNIRLNKRLNASLFVFKPPPGVDVLQ